MIRPVLVALALLTGCADRSTPQGACEAQANEDPAVKAIIVKGMGNPVAQAEDQDRLRAARQDATLACLRSRGIIRQGGVERQKPL